MTFTDTNLTPGTTYKYRIRAFDAAGNESNKSLEVTVTTDPAPITDLIPPSVPAGLAAVSAGLYAVELSWTASTDDVAVDYYEVRRNGSTIIASPTLVSYTDTGLDPDTAYSYEVRAVDTSGNTSAWCGSVSVSTDAFPSETEDVFTDGDVGIYKFDEGSGTTVDDCSGTGNLATWTGVPSYDAVPPRGTLARFLPASLTFASVKDSPTWNFDTGYLTICAWVYTSQVTAAHIISHGYASTDSGNWAIIKEPLSIPIFAAYDDSGVEARGNFTGWTAGTWHHLAVVWNKSSVGGWAKLYLDGVLVNTLTFNCSSSIAGPVHMGARGVTPDNYFDGYLNDVVFYDKELTAGQIAAIAGGGSLTSKTVVVGACQPSKLLYKHYDPINLPVAVRNLTALPQTPDLRVRLISEANTIREIYNAACPLAANERQVINIATGLSELMAVEVEASLIRSGPVVTSKVSDVFSVADDWWSVSIGSPQGGILHESGLYSLAEADIAANNLRAQYCNWYEIDFWAMDDFGNLTPSPATWISGQSARTEEKAILKRLISSGHTHGIKAVSYGKNLSCGPSGYELVRTNPTWFKTAPYGSPLDYGHAIWDLDQWDTILPGDTYRIGAIGSPGNKFTYDWNPQFPDLRLQSPLDYGINQLIASSVEYGWDGVRFDGDFSVVDPSTKPVGDVDEWSTYNNQRLKTLVGYTLPDYQFGFNSFSANAYYTGSSYLKQFSETMNNGLLFHEPIAEWTYSPGRTYTTFLEYDVDEASRIASAVELGGHVGYVYFTVAQTDNQKLYKFVLGTSNGAHPAYGEHTEITGCSNWGKFLTRWSTALWHQKLRPISSPESMISVNAPSDVWWVHKAKELVVSSTSKFWFIHLVNPPIEPTGVSGEVTIPSAQSNITITVNRGGNVLVGAWLVKPEQNQSSYSRTALVASAGVNPDESVVTVPTLDVWSFVIFEWSGTGFVIPSDPASVTPSIDIATSRANHTAELASSATDAQNGTFVWRALDYSNSSHYGVASDATAKDGACAVIDSDINTGTSLSPWNGPNGQVRCTFRLQCNTNVGFLLKLSAYADAEPGFPSASVSHSYSRSDFTALGVWQDFSFVYDHRINTVGNTSRFVCYIAGISSGDIKIDTITLEYLSPITDTDISGYFTPTPTVAAGFGGGTKVALLRGLHWPYHRVEEAITSLGGLVTLYESHPSPIIAALDLTKFNTVVMADYPCPSDYLSRYAIMSWVKSGGRLIVLGGIETLGVGKWKNTYLSDITPIELPGTSGAFDIIETTLTLGPTSGVPYAGNPKVYYVHNATPVVGSTVLMYGGTTPIMVKKAVDAGEVIVFLGTPLGTAGGGETAYWDWASWIGHLASLINTGTP